MGAWVVENFSTGRGWNLPCGTNKREGEREGESVESRIHGAKKERGKQTGVGGWSTEAVRN